MDFDLSDVVKKLPADLKDAAGTEDAAWMRRVLDEAESRLLNLLLTPEEDA